MTKNSNVLGSGFASKIKFSKTQPISLSNLTILELDKEIDKGFSDIENGHFHTFENIVKEFEHDYKV